MVSEFPTVFHTDRDKEMMRKMNRSILLLLKNELLEQSMNTIINILENIAPFSAMLQAKNDEIDALNKRNRQFHKVLEMRLLILHKTDKELHQVRHKVQKLKRLLAGKKHLIITKFFIRVKQFLRLGTLLAALGLDERLGYSLQKFGILADNNIHLQEQLGELTDCEATRSRLEAGTKIFDQKDKIQQLQASLASGSLREGRLANQNKELTKQLARLKVELLTKLASARLTNEDLLEKLNKAGIESGAILKPLAEIIPPKEEKVFRYHGDVVDGESPEEPILKLPEDDPE